MSNDATKMPMCLTELAWKQYGSLPGLHALVSIEKSPGTYEQRTFPIVERNLLRRIIRYMNKVQSHTLTAIPPSIEKDIMTREVREGLQKEVSQKTPGEIAQQEFFDDIMHIVKRKRYAKA